MTKILKKRIEKIIRMKEIGALSGLIILIVVFSILSNKFFTIDTFVGVFTITSELGIIAIGICFLMIAGEFDLSVGSTFAVAPMIGALLMNAGVPIFISFLAGLLFAAVIGFINGIIVVKAEIPSFIVTLGTMMFFRGLLLAVSGGFPIVFKGNNYGFLNDLGGELFFGMKVSGIWFICATILFTVILNHTKYGNHVFAVGGNQGTAKALGINVERVKIINFIICAVMAGLAGFTMFGRFHSIDPTAGMNLELEAITAAVIGGALLTGGYGSIAGAFIGAFIIGLMRNGMILAGAPAYWYKGLIGLVLIISVIINTKIRKAVAG